MTIDLELSEVYEPIYDMEKEGSQKILLYSPRTSAKSTNLGLLIFLYYEKFRDYDVGIGVDSFNNAGDGVLAEFQSFIEAHGLNRNGQWVFGKNETYKKGRTNVIKTYAVQTNRLEDVNRTKSKKLIRPISLFVMDEVQKLHSKKILDNCLSTFLRQMKGGHRKIILAGNPDRRAMWFHEYYKAKSKDPNWIVLKPIYKDILEWLPQDLYDEILAMQRDDPIGYAQIYLGDLDVLGWENCFHSFLADKHYIPRDWFILKDSKNGSGALINSIVIGIDDAERVDALAGDCITVHRNGMLRAQEGLYLSCKELPTKPALSERCDIVIEYLDYIQSHFNKDRNLPIIMVFDCAGGMYQQMVVLKKTDKNFLRWRNVTLLSYTDKQEKERQYEMVNAAFAKGVLTVVDVDKYSPQYSNKILCEQLKAVRLSEKTGKLDGTVPNDRADSLQYAVMTVLRNPYNLTFPDRLARYENDYSESAFLQKLQEQEQDREY